MKKLLPLLLIVFIISCSSPLDKKYSENTSEKDVQELYSELDSAEILLIAGTMIRLSFKDENLDNYTYRELLENGKAWKLEQDKIEAEQKALAEKAKLEEEARIKKLSESVIVTCFEKSYLEFNYQEYITYKFVIKNKSNKGIRAIKGNISFTNLFDDKIKSFDFVYDKPIEAGKEVKWDAQTGYNQFISDDVTLKNKDLKDLKTVWKPIKIIFEDGTTLE